MPKYIGGNDALISPQSNNHRLLGVGTIGSSGMSAAIWPTANMIYYWPFVVFYPYTIHSGWIAQNAAGASSVGRIGVYSRGGTKLDETNGTIDLTTAGGNVIRRTAFTSKITLVPGNEYYCAITVNSSGAWTGIGQGYTGYGVTPTDGGDVNGWRQEAGAGTLPATATMADYAPATERAWCAGLTNNATVPL